MKGYLAIILLLPVTFLTCDKEEDVRGNLFRIEEEEFEIGSAQLVNLGEVDTIYQLVLTLVSDGVQLHRPHGGRETVSGKGNVFFLYLNAADTIIQQGEVYTYADDESLFSYEGEYHINWDIASDEVEYFSELSDGTLEVSRSAKLFVLMLNGVDNTGDEVELYYRGELDYYNANYLR